MPSLRRLLVACVTATAACALPPSSPAVVDDLGLAAMSRMVDDGAFGEIAAIVVSRNGQTVFEDYFGGAGPDSQIDMKSVGKSITALAVGAAIDDGIIDGVQTPVLAAFADRTGSAPLSAAQKDIRLADLLSMRSALACDDWQDSPGNEERMYRTRDWTEFVLDLPLEQESVTDVRTRFSYCTAGVFLIGQFVEARADVPFDVFVQRRLFDPLGITSVVWRRSPTGEIQSGGQMQMRARDAAKLGQLVLERGKWNGTRIVSEDWIRQMVAPRPVAGAPFRYGYLWWVRDLRIGATDRRVTAEMMIGNGGNIVAVVPEFDAVIVIQAKNYGRPGQYAGSETIVQGFILPALAQSARRPSR